MCKGVVNLKFSVCIDMMFPHAGFIDRIELAKQNGADAVEFWKWSDKDLDATKSAVQKNGLEVCLMNLDSSDSELSHALSRGILSHNRKDDLVKAIKETSASMEKLGMKKKKAIVLTGDIDPDIPLDMALENAAECLSYAIDEAKNQGMELVLEPLNTYDRQSYVMPYSHQGFDIVKKVNSPSLKLLLDIYHTQRMEGNLIHTISENIGLIGHFHVANSPWRCEPDCGEIDYGAVLCEIEKLGYNAYVGFEYRIKNPDFNLGKYISSIRKDGLVK